MWGVHRWIIEALGDGEAIAQIEPDNYLPADKFGQAIERVRQAHFPSLPIWEGAKRVGARLADSFLDSPNGQMIAHSISAMPLDRAMEAVVVPLSERMRKAAEFDFVPDADGKGGRIEVRGAFVVSAATLEGFFGAVVARIPGDFVLRVAEQRAQSISLAIRPRGQEVVSALAAAPRPIIPE